MTLRSAPQFKDYLGAGLLGFGVATLSLMILVSYIDFEAFPFIVIATASLLPHILGGMVSGYLVSKKATYDYLKVGLLVGLSCFFVTLIVTIALFQNTSGIWSLIGFFLGGYSGVLIEVKKSAK